MTGITLEINKTRITEGATAVVPRFDSAERNCILTMKLSMPKNIDGDILLNIKISDIYSSKLSSLEGVSLFTLKYRKEFEKITTLSRNEGITESKSEEKNDFVSKTIKIDITPHSKIDINLKISEKYKPFIMIASDNFKA